MIVFYSLGIFSIVSTRVKEKASEADKQRVTPISDINVIYKSLK